MPGAAFGDRSGGSLRVWVAYRPPVESAPATLPLLLAGSAERALVLEAEPEGPGAAQFH